MTAAGSPSGGERAELLQALAEQRDMLLIAVRGLDDAQAAARTTVSALSLGGIIRHLAQGNRAWAQIVAGRGETPEGFWDMEQYQMRQTDTLAALLEEYAAAARALEDAVVALPDLDRPVPLPDAPWAPGVVNWWSPRRILYRLLRETAQHAGHADIIRESLDGASTTAQLGT